MRIYMCMYIQMYLLVCFVVCKRLHATAQKKMKPKRTVHDIKKKITNTN